MKISVIIPCFNDYKYLKSIVDQIDQLSTTHEIILVNDGSGPETQKVLKTIHNAIVINHPRNMGKSQAMKTGLLASKGEYVVFLDSDFTNFQTVYLEKLIEPVINNLVEISIGEFDDGFSPFQKIGLTSMLTGIRCLPRKVLINNIDIFNNQGYFHGFFVEIKMNQRIYRHFKIIKVKLVGLKQQFKYQKVGFLRGFHKDIKIMYDIYHYLGNKQYFNQLKFARNLPTI